jgi:hypothetical protein
VIFKNERPVFEDHFPILEKGPLLDQEVEAGILETIMEGFA